jgi:hypothetical protein
MPSGVSAGHQTTLSYLWEDSFGVGPSSISDSTHKLPGADPTVGTTEGSNAVRRVFRPAKRAAIDQIAMLFEGSFSLSFSLTNPWWLRTLLGAPTPSGSGPDYTYDYGLSQDGEPDTMQIYEGHEQSGKARVLQGCMVTSATIDTAVEEEASVTLNGAYADETIQSSIPTQPTKEVDPLTFAEGSISVGGTTEKYVQSMTLDLQNTIDPVREMGTRFFIDYNPKTIEPSVDFGNIFDGDHDQLEQLFGGSGETSPLEDADDNDAAVEMTFDNGKTAGQGVNNGTFTISGTLVNSYDEGGIGDPRADLEETINRSGLEPSVSWTNETSTAP